MERRPRHSVFDGLREQQPARWAACSPGEQTVMAQVYRVLDGSRMAAAGAGAGIIARTATAPFDRVKLLFQVQAVAATGGSALKADSYTGLGQATMKILREEGVLSFWKGNGVNIIRIAPYSAAQLASNDFYKRVLADENGKLGIAQRLTAGALAGMTGTALTHPLDTVRLRLALPNSGYTGMFNAFSTMYRTEGIAALYKGLPATLAGIAPYAACNFATYDIIKKAYYDHMQLPDSKLANMGLGASAGIMAATVCYPLDTVRRRMQMKGAHYTSMLDALVTIARKEGVQGFFKGWSANTIKVAPQNAIRFVSYEMLKQLLGVQKAKTDT
mmetsp:Transcript_21346/g.69102  ORF Transcript_21346/g.69102 Transcript_21346/m.69102 type:complete len:330 (+) Transcript_21346:1499-2488(+)